MQLKVPVLLFVIPVPLGGYCRYYYHRTSTTSSRCILEFVLLQIKFQS